MHDGHIIVVKLGGSLAGSRHLADWVGALAACGGRSVVVPGGGPFADAVRAGTSKNRISAIPPLTILLLSRWSNLDGRLQVSTPTFVSQISAIAIGNALRAGNVPIWSPVKMVLDCREIPASWGLTSDSLAAWLAGQIGARQIVLVKHGAAFGNPPSVVDLAARGIVDQAFPRFLASSGAQASIVAAEASGSAQKAISERGMPGTLIGLMTGLRGAYLHHYGQGQTAALGMGTDRLGALLQGVSQHYGRTGRGRYFRHPRGRRGHSHVPAGPSEVDACLSRYHSQRSAGRRILLWHIPHSRAGARNIEHGGKMRLWDFGYVGDERVRASRQVPRIFHCLCLRHGAELETEAPKGMVKVYPRQIDLENTARLKSFNDVNVVENLDELRDALSRRKRELA